MQIGWEIVGAKKKATADEERPTQEPMRPAVGPRRNPSTDQLKARRQLAKSAGKGKFRIVENDPAGSMARNKTFTLQYMGGEESAGYGVWEDVITRPTREECQAFIDNPPSWFGSTASKTAASSITYGNELKKGTQVRILVPTDIYGQAATGTGTIVGSNWSFDNLLNYSVRGPGIPSSTGTNQSSFNPEDVEPIGTTAARHVMASGGSILDEKGRTADAATILQQIGTSTLRGIGWRDAVNLGDGVMGRVGMGSTLRKLIVKLNGHDTYDIEIGRMKRGSFDWVSEKLIRDVYPENMSDIVYHAFNEAFSATGAKMAGASDIPGGYDIGYQHGQNNDYDYALVAYYGDEYTRGYNEARQSLGLYGTEGPHTGARREASDSSTIDPYQDPSTRFDAPVNDTNYFDEYNDGPPGEGPFDDGNLTTRSTMNREAALLAAIPKATGSEQIRLVAELDNLRAQRRAARAAAMEVDLGARAVADHLTPVISHTFHSASTDWLGTMADEEHNNLHQAAKAEAIAWGRRVHAAVREHPEEYMIQAEGYARTWSSQFGFQAPEAYSSFVAMAGHLVGIEGKTAGGGITVEYDPHDNAWCVSGPAPLYNNYGCYRTEEEARAVADSRTSNFTMPAPGTISDGWTLGSLHTADQGIGPSEDSQSGFAETGLDPVDVDEAPEDSNLGWIGGTDADDTTFNEEGDGTGVVARRRTAADYGPAPKGVTQENWDRAGDNAGLGVGHIWSNTSCPAYRTYDPDDCTCNGRKNARRRMAATEEESNENGDADGPNIDGQDAPPWVNDHDEDNEGDDESDDAKTARRRGGFVPAYIREALRLLASDDEDDPESPDDDQAPEDDDDGDADDLKYEMMKDAAAGPPKMKNWREQIPGLAADDKANAADKERKKRPTQKEKDDAIARDRDGKFQKQVADADAKRKRQKAARYEDPRGDAGSGIVDWNASAEDIIDTLIIRYIQAHPYADDGEALEWAEAQFEKHGSRQAGIADGGYTRMSIPTQLRQSGHTVDAKSGSDGRLVYIVDGEEMDLREAADRFLGGWDQAFGKGASRRTALTTRDLETYLDTHNGGVLKDYPDDLIDLVLETGNKDLLDAYDDGEDIPGLSSESVLATLRRLAGDDANDLEASGDDSYDPGGSGNEDGTKPASAAPMVQPGDEGDVAMFEPEFPEPENTDADKTAAMRPFGGSRTAAKWPTGRSSYEPGKARTGEPTPQTAPGQFSSEDILAEVKYLMAMNGREGSNPLRTMKYMDLMKVIKSRPGETERLSAAMGN